MGVGHAAGKNKAEDAARQAVSSPLMETSIDGAKGVLVNITGSLDIGLEDVEVAACLVQQAAHPDANIIFGATFDETMDDEIRVTVIATRFDDKPRGGPAAASTVETKPGAGLFTEAVEKKEAEVKPAEPPQEEDPFDTIFKIFNSK
jgi:cell division protein FtsZ